MAWDAKICYFGWKKCFYYESVVKTEKVLSKICISVLKLESAGFRHVRMSVRVWIYMITDKGLRLAAKGLKGGTRSPPERFCSIGTII